MLRAHRAGLRAATAALAVALGAGAASQAAAQAPSQAGGPTSPWVAGAQASAAPAAMRLPFQKHTLPNGLEVIVHEDHRTPVVAVNLWYHVGSKDEAAGKSGFAHLFEHMMFQGSRHVEAGMFLRYLDAVGATDRNATTNTDRTTYFETVPRGRLELALWLESDRMAFLLDRMDQKVFDNEREVVKNERRERYDNVPYGLVPQFVRAAIFPAGHPYRELTIGSPRDLDAATLADVRAFFRAYYVPNNATLVLAGDVDPTASLELVTRYFGPIPRGNPPPTPPAPSAGQPEGERRLRVEADVELPRLYVSWPSPGAFAEGDAELDALGRILANGRSSRLYQRLVHDMAVAQQVGVRQASAQLGSIFEIVVTLKQGGQAAEALKAIDEELGRLRATEPSADELTRARARLVTRVVFANERVSYKANSLNAYNQLAGDAGFIERDLARFRGLTGQAVQRAVRAHLATERRVVTVVEPTRGAPQAGRLAVAP
jgi:zinc protease